jgi:hypothetical protein
MIIIFVVISGYCISGYWWLLVAIDGYYINDYWWLFHCKPLVAMDNY